MCIGYMICPLQSNVKFYDNHIYLTPPLGQDMTQGQFFKYLIGSYRLNRKQKLSKQ